MMKKIMDENKNKEDILWWLITRTKTRTRSIVDFSFVSSPLTSYKPEENLIADFWGRDNTYTVTVNIIVHEVPSRYNISED